MLSVQERDGRWFELASSPLGTGRNRFQSHLNHNDSILLATVISIVRRSIETYSGSAERHRSEILGASSKTLGSLRKLHLNRTSSDLQHEFCGIWNHLVELAQNDDRPDIVYVSTTILKSIRKLYIRLHKKGTSAYPTAFSSTTDDAESVLGHPSSYCRCTVIAHHPPQPVPGLQIEEPAPEVGISSPPTPWTIPVWR